MFDRIISELGPWNWMVLGFVLLVMEVIAPGIFMLWIGIAAGIMGAIVLLVPTLSAIAQALVFALLAILTCTIYWRFIRPLAEHRNDQPLLNRRGAKLVGQRFVIVESIVNGRGKVKVGDSSWLAEGPDLPAGTEVEVIATDGSALKVQKAG